MSAVETLLQIMRDLRAPDGGCPWDKEQTFDTIAPYTVEEAYEVADAIEQHDMPSLKDELGDLLFQVVFHAQMAAELGHFTFDDVAEAIVQKMIRRHPHVFGTAEIKNADQQIIAWEESKASERQTLGHKSELDGIASSLPPLKRAIKLQRRAARVGFDWPDADSVIPKIKEELGEIHDEVARQSSKDRLEDEMGDLLFACLNLARKLDVDPDTCLRKTNGKFERRFRFMENQLGDAGRQMDCVSLEELESLWQDAKRIERTKGSL